MTYSSGLGAFVIAVIVTAGSFAYIILRGGSDPVVMPILAGALGSVLSFFFARQISNGAATNALNAMVVHNQGMRDAIATAVAQPSGGPLPKA